MVASGPALLGCGRWAQTHSNIPEPSRMALINGTEMVPIAQIIVKQEARQRQGELKTEDLQKSIARVGEGELNIGIINALVVERSSNVLVAGERRLTAALALGHTLVPVRWTDQLDPVDAQIIELEENIKRKDLEWQDLVRGIGRIHRLFREKDPDWTMTETAEEVSLTQGTVSMYLRIEAELSDTRIAGMGTAREAYNILGRRDQRAQGDALEELLGGAAPQPVAEPETKVIIGVDPAKPGSEGTVYTLQNTKTGEVKVITKAEAEKIQAKLPAKPKAQELFSGILNESFLTWAPRYTGPKFNLIHCDFPYGVNLFDGPQGRGAEPSAGYVDTASTYDELIIALCENLDRLMTLSGHLMFWLSADTKIVAETVAKFAKLAPSLAFHKFPLIWFKSDNSGIASDPTHGPRHVYETCLLASRSKRQIVRVKADTYSSGTDKRLHPSTKPESMLRHFMEMLVDENTLMLDPTCGSGASLRAAESLGAKHVLGLELDVDFCEAAQKELKRFRTLREASAKLKA